MHPVKKHTRYFWILAVLLVVTILVNVSLGSVSIPLGDVISSLFGQGASKETWSFIITEYRVPKAITAILTGSALAVSGLLMQTLFRNPLAGPFVLGLSSVAKSMESGHCFCPGKFFGVAGCIGGNL